MAGATAAYEAIRLRMNSLWEGPEPVLYEQDGQKPPSNRSPWLRLTVREGKGMALEVVQDTCVRIVGLIQVECFQNQGTGTSRARSLADRTVPIFEGKEFDGIMVRDRQQVSSGPDDAGWYRHFIQFPYERDDVIGTAS